MSTRIFSLLGNIKLDGMDKVEASVKGLEAKLKPLQKTLGIVGRELSSMGAALSKNISAPMIAAGAAIGALALKTGNYADKLLDLNQITGLSTDSIQEFEHVARTAGVSSDGFLNVIQRLNRALPQIAEGTGTQAEAMDKLGISVTNADGSFRDMNELFPQIINALQGMDDITERNIIASQLFGRNLRDVAPILGMTAEEMAKVRQEAHDTGKVMGEDAIKSANDFRISVENLKADMAMLGNQIAMNFMPILKDQLVPFIQDSVIPLFRKVGDVMGDVVQVFLKMPAPIKGLILVLGAVVAAAGPVLLIAGKLAMSFTALIPVLVTLKGAFIAAGVAAKSFLVTIAANPVILATTAAVVALGYAVKVLVDELNGLEQVRLQNERFEEISKESDALIKQMKITKQLVDEQKALQGTEAFDEEEFKKRVKAYEDIKVQLAENSAELRKEPQLNEDAKEAVRAKAREYLGVSDAIAQIEDKQRQTEYAAAQAAKAEEEAARKREAATKAAIEAAKRLKEEYASLLAQHKDAYEKIGLSEMELLDRAEKAELEKAKKFKDNQELILAIQTRYAAERQKIYDDEDRAESERRKRNIQGFEEQQEREREAREKTAADMNAMWRDKLLQQTGDRMAILDAEYAKELAKVVDAEGDVLAVHQYYAIERTNLELEIAEERKRIQDEADRTILENMRRMYSAIGDFVVGTFNKIGSLLSQHSKNNEARVAKEYQERREYIEANVNDEEERAARLEELNAEEDAKRLEIQREQAKRDKALGVFNTIVDTARAIVKTLAEMGPIAGPVMAGVIGALGAAQTGIIMSAPEPFYAGGLIKGSENGIVAQVGERDQDELIMPLATGIDKLAEGIVGKLQGAHSVSSPSSQSGFRPVNLNVGVLVADKHGLMELERKMRTIRIAEDRRTGVSV